jgi:pantothenate kinase
MRYEEIQFPAALEVTEQQIDLSALSERQKAFYLGLFAWIVDVYTARKKPRFVLGVAGPTGAGKSVIALLFKELSKQAGLPFAVEAITIDAYHYTNEFLLSHFSEGQPLKKVKGRFDTYRPDALAADLRNYAAGRAVSFPAYSRKLHDPIPNAVTVTGKNVLLIVEGLWVLFDQGGWENIAPLLDYSLFIEADPARAKEPVLLRHLRGGRSREDAERHYETVDAENSALVLATRHKATKIIPPYYSV